MTSTPLDDNLIHLVMQLNRQLVKQMSGHGLPVDQWRVLSLLRENPDGMTMGSICERLGVQAPSMTKLIERMVGDALVYRVPSTSDRRVIMIMASEKGLAVLEETDRKTVLQYNEALSSEFDRQDVERLQKMLGRLLDKA